MLRAILKGKDSPDNLHWYLPNYFENINLTSETSAYNFAWLNQGQTKSLNCMLEFLSEEYGDDVGLAKENLNDLHKKYKQASQRRFRWPLGLVSLGRFWRRYAIRLPE